jgi:hypothetical protein
MARMPEVKDWPNDGRMDYEGTRYKIQNRTADPFPFVIRHQPDLSTTTLVLQMDLIKMLDKRDAVSVPGRMAPKQYVVCNSTVHVH